MTLQANNITIDVDSSPPTIPFSLVINPLSNDLLGFTPTLVTNIELPLMSDEFVLLSEDNIVTVEYHHYDDITEEWIANVMGTTFNYTIVGNDMSFDSSQNLLTKKTIVVGNNINTSLSVTSDSLSANNL